MTNPTTPQPVQEPAGAVEALKIARAAFVRHTELTRPITTTFEAIEAIDAALASLKSGGMVLWQYRWTNPGGYLHQSDEALAWKPVDPENFQTIEDKVSELRGYKFKGKHCYEVRPLYAAPQEAVERQPLTLEEIGNIGWGAGCVGLDWDTRVAAVRAVERFLGIGPATQEKP